MHKQVLKTSNLLHHILKIVSTLMQKVITDKAFKLHKYLWKFTSQLCSEGSNNYCKLNKNNLA